MVIDNGMIINFLASEKLLLTLAKEEISFFCASDQLDQVESFGASVTSTVKRGTLNKREQIFCCINAHSSERIKLGLFRLQACGKFHEDLEF